MKGLLPILENIIADAHILSPEIALSGGLLLLIILDLFLKPSKKHFNTYFTILILGVTAGLVLSNQPEPVYYFEGSVYLNKTTNFIKFILAVSLLFTLLLADIRQNDLVKEFKGEFCSFLLASLLGMYVALIAANFILLIVGLELVSMCGYILVSYGGKRKGGEASVKYLVFGAFSTAIMLYGVSMLFGFTGSLYFYEISQGTFLANDGILAFITILAVLAGLFFKSSLIPLHIWVPDVYQGAYTPVTAFLSVAPKILGIVILIKLMVLLDNTFLLGWLDVHNIIAVLALITMFAGNLSALFQKNVKRLLAYSSIAQGGFLIAAALTWPVVGGEASLYYIIMYMALNFGSFAIVMIYQKMTGFSELEDFRGQGKANIYLNIALIIFMVGLTGLPPTGGFTAKFLLFSALWEVYGQTQAQWPIILLLAGIINTVISLFFYLKIPYYLFLKKNDTTVNFQLSIYEKIIVTLLIMIVMIGFFKADWITLLIENSITP